MSKFRLS